MVELPSGDEGGCWVGTTLSLVSPTAPITLVQAQPITQVTERLICVCGGGKKKSGGGSEKADRRRGFVHRLESLP